MMMTLRTWFRRVDIDFTTFPNTRARLDCEVGPDVHVLKRTAVG